MRIKIVISENIGFTLAWESSMDGFVVWYGDIVGSRVFEGVGEVDGNLVGVGLGRVVGRGVGVGLRVGIGV
jgi:hypothetical protein